MKKILISFLSALSLIFMNPALAFAAGSTLSLSPPTGTFNKNCNFSLTVNLDTSTFETAGTDVIINYDTTRFVANKISNGSIYPDYTGNSIDTLTGTILISGLASATSFFKGAGTFATIDFTVLETAPVGATQIKFDFDPNDKSKTTDTNVVEITTMVETLNQVVNGNYVIGTGSCGQGGPISTGSATITQPPRWTPTQAPLPGTADVNPTLILVGIGGSLTFLGFFSLARR
ncbi:MAG: cohesin domain-containing protein [Candidatus Daviesbacteria bacterium]|nr:cohesin domain-containing protein [Candidatus Daviesbacteria bacterium]